jgi:hypothetical protein
VDDCNLCFKCHTGKSSGRKLLERSGTWRLEAIAGATEEASLSAQPRAESAAALGSAARLPHSRSALHVREKRYEPPGFSFKVMPLKAEMEAKALKPNCTECYGCDTQIQPLQAGPAEDQLGQQAQLKMEVGASPEWLFFAGGAEPRQHARRCRSGRSAQLRDALLPLYKTHEEACVLSPASYDCRPAGHRADWAESRAQGAARRRHQSRVVTSPSAVPFTPSPLSAHMNGLPPLPPPQVWCMPVDKVTGDFRWRCTDTSDTDVEIQFLMAQQKVMQDCGLMDVTVKVRCAACATL